MTGLTLEQRKLNNNLVDACKKGSLLRIKRLLAKGADVNAGSGSPIGWASYYAHLKVVKYLIDYGANVNEKWPAIHYALAPEKLTNDHIEVTQYLIENNAELNLIKQSDFIYRVSFDFVKYLMEKGFNLPKEHKFNLVIRACEAGDLDTIKCLVRKGFRVTTNDNEALKVASQNQQPEIVKYLIEKGADVSSSDNFAVRCALFNKNFELVKHLVEKGASPNFKIEASSTIEYMDIVKYLFEKGANVNNSYSFFSLACSCGDIEMVKYLHLQGVNVNNGHNPIIDASCNGHLEIVKYLHQNGADIRIKNDYMVINATCNGRIEVVKYLVANGLDFEAHFALQSASSYGNLELIKFFLSEGAGIHIADKFGQTAIGLASKNGHLNAVKYLHQQGADLDIALENVKENIKEELIAYKTNFDEKSLMQGDLKEGSLKPSVKGSGLRV